jgi:hypothetical protein
LSREWLDTRVATDRRASLLAELRDDPTGSS